MPERFQRGTPTQSSGDQVLVLRWEKEFKDTTKNKQESSSFIKAKYIYKKKCRQTWRASLAELSGLWAFVSLVGQGLETWHLQCRWYNDIMISQT